MRSTIATDLVGIRREAPTELLGHLGDEAIELQRLACLHHAHNRRFNLIASVLIHLRTSDDSQRALRIQYDMNDLVAVDALLGLRVLLRAHHGNFYASHVAAEALIELELVAIADLLGAGAGGAAQQHAVLAHRERLQRARHVALGQHRHRLDLLACQPVPVGEQLQHDHLRRGQLQNVAPRCARHFARR